MCVLSQVPSLVVLYIDFCPGPTALDESVDVARTVSAGDESAVLFTLFPIGHGGTDKLVTMKNKRLLEDRIVKPLGLFCAFLMECNV